MALPIVGHPETAFHIMAYLQLKYNSWLSFDPKYSEIDHSQFKKSDWTEFYGDAKEAILPNS